MDKLPTEIVRVIAKFELIPVMLFRNSLENLLRISEHPVYRNYVLTIEYGGEMVSNPKSSTDWTDRLFPEPQNNPFSESDIEEAYQSHVRYFDDQKRMKATGYDFKTLQSAISRLPNLRGVRIMSLYSENAKRFTDPPPGWGDAFCHMAKVMSNRDLFFLQWRPTRFIRETMAVLTTCKLAPRALSWFDCKRFEVGLLTCDGDEDEDG